MIHKITNGKLEIKRLHFPLTIYLKCPKCNTICVMNFDGDDYLSYPKLGEFNLDCYCKKCGHEWNVPATLTITLDIGRHRKS